jgi:hypothetical protein
MKCPIVIRILGYGYSEGFFSRLGREKHGVKGGTGPLIMMTFAIVGGADVSKFTLKGNELTFKATDFEARSDATYRVNIKATKGNETTIVINIIDFNGGRG